MEQSHPREAHWYLPQIGVDPNARGKGIGAALMRHALVRCDQEQALAYLEASKPQNVPFYQRHGFEVIGEFQIGAAPLVMPMLRRPRR
ncbi:GNAT family N-acetyltransferase [Luteimonas cucumeris]|uniref:GNAT family N-acetyltransferase n=1 Tax=Luteimonas cucumeris TaxID=985012 RepID=UPI003CCCB345